MLFALMCMMIFPMIQLQAQEQGVAENDIVGIWINEETQDTLSIYKLGDNFFGKIDELKEPNDSNGNPRTDINNPDPKLRMRLLKGLTFLTGCEFDHDEWDNGSYYNYVTGETNNCKIKIPDVNNKNRLSIKTFSATSSGKTTYWTKKKTN